MKRKWLDLPWQKVRDSVDVKLFEQDGELYVLAKSEGEKPKRQLCAASVWPACSESSVPCAETFLHATSC